MDTTQITDNQYPVPIEKIQFLTLPEYDSAPVDIKIPKITGNFN